MTKLLSCPFCGEQPAECVMELEDGEPTGAWVNCSCGVETVERRTFEEAAAHWNTRLAAQSAAPVGEDIVEVWHGGRKVTIYPDCVLRVWGTNIHDEMSDEPRNLNSVQSALDWLYAAPAPSPPEVSGWQPIETSPRDGTAIIATDCRVHDWTQIVFWDSDRPNGYVWARDDAGTFWHKDMFTHWMPVPPAPANPGNTEP